MILYGGLPHWLARTVGPLAHHGSLADDGTVLESPEQIRSHTQKEASQVEAATGLSAPVAALLLRHYGHSEIAIEQPLGTASRLLAAVFQVSAGPGAGALGSARAAAREATRPMWWLDVRGEVLDEAPRHLLRAVARAATKAALWLGIGLEESAKVAL